MKQFIATLLLLSCCCLAAMAQVNSHTPLVKVDILPVKMSWDYAAGEKIKMEVRVLKDELPLENLSFKWTAGPEMMPPTISKEASTGPKGTVTLDAGTMREAGFYTVGVSVEVDGRRYDQWKTVSVDRDKISPTVTMPADFAAWWDAQRALDAAMPLAPTMRLLPERCTSTVEVYEASYVVTPQGGRMYGILCVPRAPGKYPAILNVPGAGIREYYGSVPTAERGYVVFDVAIHGIPVTLPPVVYANLREGALSAYWTLNIENRDTYYYNRVYRGCRRAIDFIYSLDKFDGERLGVAGGSQGGALAVVVSALDNRVKCASSFFPALSDMTGYLHGRAGGWPHMLRNPAQSTFNRPEHIATLSYYDVVNFARRLSAPIFYSMGYNDKVCPPTSTFSVYNVTTAPKELMLVPQTAHWTFWEQDVARDAFLDRHLKR